MIRFWPTDEIRSWGGVLRARHKVARPQWRDDLPAACAQARRDGLSVLGVGLRRSYGDSGLNPNGALVDMTSLDRAISFDPLTRLLRVEAGLSLDSILKLLVPRGFFLAVTPGTSFVTVGGAIANDVHGKNHKSAGTFGQWVRRLGLLRSDGSELDLGPDDETGLFAATVGGLGLTGLITWAEIEVVPIAGAVMDVENVPFANLDEYFELEEQDSARYAVSWVDCLARGPRLGRGLFTRGEHSVGGSRTVGRNRPVLSIPLNLPGFVLNNSTIRAFNAVHYRTGRWRSGRSNVELYPFFYPLDALGHWYRLYGRRGMYQYQSVVPADSAPDATKKMLETISRAGEGSFLAVLKSFGDKRSPGLLSFPMPGTTLALDFPNRGSSTLALMARLDAIVREAGGRLYPAKDGRIPPEMFRASYPQWQTFARFVDPSFSSHFWRRMERGPGCES